MQNSVVGKTPVIRAMEAGTLDPNLPSSDALQWLDCVDAWMFEAWGPRMSVVKNYLRLISMFYQISLNNTRKESCLFPSEIAEGSRLFFLFVY